MVDSQTPQVHQQATSANDTLTRLTSLALEDVSARRHEDAPSDVRRLGRHLRRRDADSAGSGPIVKAPSSSSHLAEEEYEACIANCGADELCRAGCGGAIG